MNTHLRRISLVFALFLWASYNLYAQTKNIWTIGRADNSPTGMALAPANFKAFLSHDFGWEDKYYVVGFSEPEKDFPYVLPGMKDKWAGTQTHSINILFDLEQSPAKGDCKLVIDLAGYNADDPMLLKVTINGKPYKFPLPKADMPNVLAGNSSTAKEYLLEIPFDASLLHAGGNLVQLITLDGSWVVFDQVRLESPAEMVLKSPRNFFVKSAEAAKYQTIQNGKHVQPLLINVLHLTGKSKMTVRLDGQTIFQQAIETGEYQFEVPMPAVKTAKQSKYQVLCDGRVIENGTVKRSAQSFATPADYVDTQMGVAHSRWMIAPGPWMPMAMVKLAPDNQDAKWWSGYDPAIESVSTFSHVHEWTMEGLGMLPVNGKLRVKMGDEHATPGTAYRSAIDKTTEESLLGYYRVDLTDYKIKAELTATTRASFQRYTYPKATDSRVMIDFKIPGEYGYDIKELKLKKVNDHRIEGFSHQLSPGIWRKTTDQDYTHSLCY